MPFVKGDKNINRAGRIKKQDKPREIRNAELLNLLRKIKPHVSKAIMTAAVVMDDNRVNAAGKLKAAQIILSNYRDIVLDLYDGEEPEEGVEAPQQEAGHVFSLRVIDNEEDLD
jgi:hypothetical protein